MLKCRQINRRNWARGPLPIHMKEFKSFSNCIEYRPLYCIYRQHTLMTTVLYLQTTILHLNSTQLKMYSYSTFNMTKCCTGLKRKISIDWAAPKCRGKIFHSLGGPSLWNSLLPVGGGGASSKASRCCTVVHRCTTVVHR